MYGGCRYMNVVLTIYGCAAYLQLCYGGPPLWQSIRKLDSSVCGDRVEFSYKSCLWRQYGTTIDYDFIVMSVIITISRELKIIYSGRQSSLREENEEKSSALLVYMLIHAIRNDTGLRCRNDWRLVNTITASNRNVWRAIDARTHIR